MKKEVTEQQLIDIEGILKKRVPALVKWMPFVVRYLKRIIHQDEFNAHLVKYKDYEGVDFIDKSLFERFNIKPIIIGKENIPKTENKKYIFASNHPLGGVDGLLLITIISKLLGPTKAIINDLLLNVIALRPVFVGVNLYGSKSRNSIQRLDEAFNSDNQMMLFPAGLVSRRQKGAIRDLKWKNTFIKRAIKHQRDIIPVHVDGRLSNFFYNLSNFRKFIGIKFNFELIYLADEMFKQSENTITVKFGKPIPWQSLDKSKTPDEWAAYIKELSYSL